MNFYSKWSWRREKMFTWGWLRSSPLSHWRDGTLATLVGEGSLREKSPRVLVQWVHTCRSVDSPCIEQWGGPGAPAALSQLEELLEVGADLPRTTLASLPTGPMVHVDDGLSTWRHVAQGVGLLWRSVQIPLHCPALAPRYSFSSPLPRSTNSFPCLGVLERRVLAIFSHALQTPSSWLGKDAVEGGLCTAGSHSMGSCVGSWEKIPKALMAFRSLSQGKWQTYFPLRRANRAYQPDLIKIKTVGASKDTITKLKKRPAENIFQ